MRQPHFLTFVSTIGATLLALATTQTAQACASCGCSLSSDWDNPGVSGGTGVKLDVRYDYLNQNQLRSGSSTISPAAASRIVNGDDHQEVEKFTKNDYVTASLDYAPNLDWGVNLQLPYVVRSHGTLGTASDGMTPGPGGGQYGSRTGSMGDVKIIGRHQGLLPARNLSLLLGLKLPTGSHAQTGVSTDPDVTGPVPIDRGLQPGTGTTDVIVGTSYVAMLSPDWGYMVQGMFQSALHSKDGYRPGNGFNLNAGLRYTGLTSVQPQIQLNVRHVLRDTGANADNVSTGGTLVYLSPGINVPFSEQAAVYGYTQIPVMQHVNGVQLTPKFTVSVGLHYAF